jgi:hypothetical protein
LAWLWSNFARQERWDWKGIVFVKETGDAENRLRRHYVDQEGRSVRDEESTSYTGAIETAELFGKWIYQEAMRRGMDRAREVCVLGVGAIWIWNVADEQFYTEARRRELYDLFSFTLS